MKSIVIKTFIVALSFSSLFILSGCLKGEFDTPPTGAVILKFLQIRL